MIPKLDKLAYSIPNFAEAVDLSVTTIRLAIAQGELKVGYPTKSARKPVIEKDEGVRWLRSLPSDPQEAERKAG
jgi:hypothetical protein